MPPSNLPSHSPWRDKTVWSWAIYDWANSAFATTIIAGFFPIFFKSFWAHDLEPHVSTTLLGITHSTVGLCLVFGAPLLGVFADLGRKKKSFLIAFTLIGVAASAGLSLLGQGEYLWAVVIFGFGMLGFNGAIVLYDSLLPDVTKPEYFHQVSSLGYSLGYLGGGLLFALQVMMTLFPQTFYLNSPQQAVQLSFAMVAIWWLAFTLPLIFHVHEREPEQPRNHLRLKDGWSELRNTFRSLAQARSLWLFFLAYLFYIDGVNTTIKMAVDYGLALGFSQENLITALLVVQFVGFPASLAFGQIGRIWGPKTGIYLALTVYVGVIIGAYHMTDVSGFYWMAVAIGCVQGGIQSLSRSFYAQMIPAEKSGEYFGLFNMVGKFSSILGPALVGLVSYSSGSSRLSILVILLFFLLGFVLLSAVKPLPHSTTQNHT